MKKFLIPFVFMLLVLACLPMIVHAKTHTEEDICNYVKEKENVIKAECVIWQRSCVVAIKTEKFINRSEYENFKADLIAELQQKFELDNVAVTRNPKTMCALSEFSKLPQETRNKAIEKFIEEYFE